MKKPWKVGAAALGVALVCCMFGCGSSELQKANDLYEEGSYREALEAYEALDDLDEDTMAKMSDCRFWMFVEKIRSEKKIETSHTESGSNTMTNTVIEARESGEIVLSYEQWHTPSGAWTNTKYTMSIPYQQSEAKVTGYCKMMNSGAEAEQTAQGMLDIGLYDKGDDIDWESTTDAAYGKSGLTGETSLGINVLNYNSAAFSLMIEDLQNTMSSSGTGITMKDIGFDNLG